MIIKLELRGTSAQRGSFEDLEMFLSHSSIKEFVESDCRVSIEDEGYDFIRFMGTSNTNGLTYELILVYTPDRYAPKFHCLERVYKNLDDTRGFLLVLFKKMLNHVRRETGDQERYYEGSIGPEASEYTKELKEHYLREVDRPWLL